MQPREGRLPEQPPEPIITEFRDRNFEECFGPDADRLEFLRDLSLADFHRSVVWANYKIRGVSSEDRGYLDPDQVDGVEDNTGHIQYVGPHGEDRHHLMEYGFEAAKRAEDPMTAGVILALTIVNARPLPAANDTTAHLAFSLMSRGYSGSPEDIEHYNKIIRGDTGRSIWDTCNRAGLPYRFAAASTVDIAAHYGMEDHVPVGVINYFPRHMQIHALPKGDPKRDAAAMADEPVLNRAVLTEFVLRAGRDLRDYLVQGPSESVVTRLLQSARPVDLSGQGLGPTDLPDGRPKRPTDHQHYLYLDAAAVIADIQPHDGGLLWDVYRTIKLDYVKSIIDCFAGNASIHGDWRIIQAHFHRLKDDIAPEKNRLPEPVPGDPILGAVRLIMETLGVPKHRRPEED